MAFTLPQAFIYWGVSVGGKQPRARVRLKESMPFVQTGAARAMAARSVHTPSAAKATLEGELAEIRLLLRRERQKLASASRVAARAWQLPVGVRHASLVAYVLAGYRSEPAVVYLQAIGRERHWPAKADGEVAALIEDLFLECEVERLAALTDAEVPEDAAAYAIASKYVKEWQAVEWVRSMNAEKGVAPSTASLLTRVKKGPPRLRGHTSSWSGSARSWACRWRRRWQGFYKKLRVREDVSLDETRSKAAMSRVSGCARCNRGDLSQSACNYSCLRLPTALLAHVFSMRARSFVFSFGELSSAKLGRQRSFESEFRCCAPLACRGLRCRHV